MSYYVLLVCWTKKVWVLEHSPLNDVPRCSRVPRSQEHSMPTNAKDNQLSKDKGCQPKQGGFVLASESAIKDNKGSALPKNMRFCMKVFESNDPANKFSSREVEHTNRVI